MGLTLRASCALMMLGAVLACAPSAAQSGPDVARAHREANQAALVRDFAEMLSYPNRAQSLLFLYRKPDAALKAR